MSEILQSPMNRQEAERLTERIKGYMSELQRDSDELEALRRKLPKESQPLNGSIYFIQAKGSQMIKIGFAVDPMKRLAQLQTANPAELDLIATIPGTVKDEKFLHRHFADTHVRGEWFQESPEIRNYIWRYSR